MSTKREWIPVGDDKPKGMSDWWVFNGEVQIAWWSRAFKVWKDADGDVVRNVTHYREIEVPEPPEVGT